MAVSHFDIVFCCETESTRWSHAAELRLPGYCAPVLFPRGSCPNGLGIEMYSRSGLAVSGLSMLECDCSEFMVAVRLNFNSFFVYRNPFTDNGVYDCFLKSLGKIQSK